MTSLALALLRELDDDALDELASLLRPRLTLSVEQTTATDADPWLAPQAAAEYLGLTRRRVYDLTSLGCLVPDGRDGRTPLFRRSSLDRYAKGEALDERP